MARRSKKLPFALVEGGPQFGLPVDAWLRIEAAYRHALPESARAAIADATWRYALRAQGEANAEREGDAVKALEAIRNGARAFRQILHETALARSDASVYAAQSIERNFPPLWFGDRRALFASLPALLVSLENACDAALADMREVDGIREGDAWTAWIRSLARILSEHGLPCSVRKDVGNKSRADVSSPFVCLVDALQRYAPARHGHSLPALAKAMTEALRDK